MSTTLTLRVLVALALSCLAACKQEIRGGEAVRTEVYVLVDLSRTWFNPEHEPKNRKLLTAVGQGAGLMVTDVETPYLVQYRAIGDQSYLREPICSVVYTPGFRRKGASKDSVSRPGNVASYLTKNCVDGILRRQPEDLTQISAAVASIAAEPRPTAKGVRSIIIISDFLEETVTAAPIPDGSLDGVRVLLLYRPLSEDQHRPSGTGARVEEWRERLVSKGATVQLAPDTSMRASQIVSFLNQ